MTLFFDANISFRIIDILKSRFPTVTHAALYNLSSATDIDIWNFAQKNNFCVLTKDSDFNDLLLLEAHRQKLFGSKLVI